MQFFGNVVQLFGNVLQLSGTREELEGGGAISNLQVKYYGISPTVQRERKSSSAPLAFFARHPGILLFCWRHVSGAYLQGTNVAVRCHRKRNRRRACILQYARSRRRLPRCLTVACSCFPRQLVVRSPLGYNIGDVEFR